MIRAVAPLVAVEVVEVRILEEVDRALLALPLGREVFFERAHHVAEGGVRAGHRAQHGDGQSRSADRCFHGLVGNVFILTHCSISEDQKYN